MVKKNKFDLVSIIVIAVLALALIMTIVGICIDWLSYTVNKVNNTELLKLPKLIENNNTANKELYAGIDAVYAFAIITVIMNALTLASYVVSKFVDIKVLKYVIIALSAVLIVCALISLIMTFTCTNTDWCNAAKKVGKFAPAAGAWLLAIFGIVGGAAGVVGALKK